MTELSDFGKLANAFGVLVVMDTDTTTPMIDWLLQAADSEASDLHLVAGYPPMIRQHGELTPLESNVISAEKTEACLRVVCPEKLFSHFQREKNLAFAPVIDVQERRILDDGQTDVRVVPSSRQQRFRANYFLADNQMGGCFRIIPKRVPDLQWAGFPDDLANTITGFRNGLVLFTGVTGSGKSTSLAMMIKRLIAGDAKRIITIEEPIEYVFDQDDGSLISQRSVGRDVDSFADGLKFGLRQDPDVMLVGEIRDRPTAQIALSAAETGHLIFATIHSRDAKGAVSRIADLFPQSSQFEIRSQLAFGLRAVISQHLLPSVIAGEKRELALEVMFNSLPIAAAIRTGKIESIDNNIQTGKSDGMYLLDDSIRGLLIDGRITRETALKFVSDARNLM